jgi:uncharacterized protein (TIGR03085 family)
MATLAQTERRSLADLLDEVGPREPTLCEGWLTADLAAHLVLRDRHPVAGLGVLIPALRDRTARVQQRIRDGHRWADLVELVRSGPVKILRPLDPLINTVEYFVHHEDVRRCLPDWTPRVLPPEQERVLWGRLRGMAFLLGRRSPVGLTLSAPGFGEARARRGHPAVTVQGSPAELVLFGFGRRAARVQFEGDELSVERLRQAAFRF